MHVAIDIGKTYTYLICRDRDKNLADAHIRVKVPGIAVFNNNCSHCCWDSEHLRPYLFHLNREYLLPSRLIVESASLIVPTMFNLNTRRIMLDIMEEMLGLPEVTIIPKPIALISGLQLQNPLDALTGDILIIHIQEEELEFAYLSIFDTAGITLEKHFIGQLPQILNNGLLNRSHSREEFYFNTLVLYGDNTCPLDIEKLLASIPQETRIITGDNLQFAAVEGISESGLRNMIYPYEFYLEKYNPSNNSYELEKIPFDTTNLELECNGQYRLAGFESSSLFDPATDAQYIKLRIYESPINTDHSMEQTFNKSLVMEIDSPRSDLPDYLEIRLDMASASLYLDLKLNSTNTLAVSAKEIGHLISRNQKNLYKLIKSHNLNLTLTEDFNNHLLSKKQTNHNPLDLQIDSTLFHIYGLLQLWQKE